MAARVDPSRVRLHCEKMVAGGAGLARDDSGRVVFVEGALPGEWVDVVLTSSRRDLAHATVVEVIESSPDRVSPPCPQVALGCGGCDWQHIAVDAQSTFRRLIVRESLQRIGRLPADVLDRVLGHPVAGDASPAVLPAEGVRTTMRLALDPDGRPGLRASRSHDVVVTDHCLVAHPLIEELLPDVLLPGAAEVNLRVGAATGERAVWWTPDEVPRPALLPADVRTGADAFVHETIDGATLRVSAGSFFQPSFEAAHAIGAAVRRAAARPLSELGADELVIDAYAGVGLLAATVVDADRPVLAIEGSRSACDDATVNLAGRRARVLRCSIERWRAEPAALVIADPSRSGLGAEGSRRLLAADPRDVVLVSCDPASLGRDAGLLAAAGFELVSCDVLDAFPHTHHVEVVSAFRRR